MRLRLGGFVADLTVMGFSRQAVVAIVIGCICLFGVIVAAMLIILMRKPPDETAAGRAAASFGGLSKATDGAPDGNAAEYNNSMYDEGCIDVDESPVYVPPPAPFRQVSDV